MEHVSLTHIIQLADQLNQDEKAILLAHLQSATDKPSSQTTLSAILSEHQRRQNAGLFDSAQSLRNLYATPDLNLSEDELLAGIKEFSTAWESEFGDPTTD
jgi:hypothetical protein